MGFLVALVIATPLSSQLLFRDGFESGTVLAWSDGVGCARFRSPMEEFSAIQTAAGGVPDGVELLEWSVPAEWTYTVAFWGVPGQPAFHEGLDFVHDDFDVTEVAVDAVADGVVSYVRSGCPQSGEHSPNTDLRECGAGWGNHVVLDHGGGLFTRYAHLMPGETVVAVGDIVPRGARLGTMGNSGRSDVRHLHFELGQRSIPLDSCRPAQSFDRVYDPAQVLFGGDVVRYGKRTGYCVDHRGEDEGHERGCLHDRPGSRASQH